ncbi:hypothetical protein QR77_30475 [Streptomyces sp. 150FB]|uniref:DUF4190 domain-containing protein n=1 Tax=Streptomyces sp. 150FB TaxID=1576605 RepID=UPI0005891399|nr:DUF4190 domain-containing protein [Streptomyces sp. 150FB]KIF77014.1 hypothetical protein QR77_30475 [Streptomyces sp. 150FB]
MSDQSEQPPGGYEPHDPWAPPEDRTSLNKPAAPAPQAPAGGGSVHDQPTAVGMPPAVPGQAAGAVPPPPPNAPGPYGYPSVPPAPTAPSAADPYASGAGYGYPVSGGAGYPDPGYPGAGYPDPGYPGAGYPTPYAAPGWQQQPANGMGVAAMVLGIVSICLFCLYGVVGIVLGVLALIFGILGKKRAERGEATNRGQAKAGIILGSIGIVIGLVVIGLLAWGITEAVKHSPDDTYDDYDGYSTSLFIG